MERGKGKTPEKIIALLGTNALKKSSLYVENYAKQGVLSPHICIGEKNFYLFLKFLDSKIDIMHYFRVVMNRLRVNIELTLYDGQNKRLMATTPCMR